MSLFWSLQNQPISDAIERAAATAPAPLPPQLDDNATDERVDQLLLVCAAMWELLCEKTNLTQEDLINRVAILDAKDGVADGKITRTPQKCPKCSRILTPKHSRCLYCGAPVPIETVFKTI